MSIELPFTHPALVEALEVIMMREGFDTIEQAAEFALAQSVREGSCDVIAAAVDRFGVCSVTATKEKKQ